MYQAASQNLQEYIHDDDDIELNLFHLKSILYIEQNQIVLPNIISKMYSCLINLAENYINENNKQDLFTEDEQNHCHFHF